MTIDPNDPSTAVVVTEVMRFIDPPEQGAVVLGMELNDESRFRVVFSPELASKAIAGLIDGLADLGYQDALRLKEQVTQLGGHGNRG